MTPTACLHSACLRRCVWAVWRVGLAAWLACVAVADSACATAATARRTPTQTQHRTHRFSGRAGAVHTSTPDTTKQSCLLVFGVAVWMWYNKTCDGWFVCLRVGGPWYFYDALATSGGQADLQFHFFLSGAVSWYVSIYGTFPPPRTSASP